MGPVPVGLFIELHGGGIQSLRVFGHAALVFGRRGLELLAQGFDGLRVLDLFGLDGGGIGGIAVEQRVVFIGIVAHGVGGGGARLLGLGELRAAVSVPADDAGHDQNHRADGRDQGRQPLRTLPSILAWLCDVLGGCFDGFEDFRLVVLVHHCSPCIDNALLICRDTRVGLQRFPRDVEQPPVTAGLGVRCVGEPVLIDVEGQVIEGLLPVVAAQQAA